MRYLGRIVAVSFTSFLKLIDRTDPGMDVGETPL
jgi:hypothetical protein